MKSKNLLSVVIAAAVIFGTTVPVFADEAVKTTETSSTAAVSQSKEIQTKISKESAKAIAKDKLKEYLDFDFDESKYQSSIELNNYRDNNYAWTMNWDYNDQEKHTNIYVAVNAATGNIIGMRKDVYNFYNNQPSIPSITYESAKDAAQAFVNKVMAEKLSQLKLIDQQADTYKYVGNREPSYNFNYKRVINEIDYANNYVSVEVDGITGKVKGFDFEWTDDVKTPDKDGIISADSAKEALKKEGSIELNYITVRDKFDNYRGNSTKTKVVYSISELSNLLIDAKTGTATNDVYGSVGRSTVKNVTQEEKQALINKAVVLTSAATEISSSEAEAAMKARLKEVYGGDYEINSISYRENSDDSETSGRKVWSAEFIKKSDQGMPVMMGSISIDALNKGIISTFRYEANSNSEEDFTPKLTWEQAYYKALDAVAKYFPDKIKEINMEQAYYDYPNIVNGKSLPQREYYFRFERVVNGVKYNADSVTINFDAKTGEISQMSSYWSDKISFPSSTGVMAKEDIQNLVFNKYQTKLAYISVPKTTNTGTTEYETKLVYKLSSDNTTYMPVYLDAFSGKFVDYDGNEINDSAKEFLEKIKGSKYEKELNILAYQGIIDTNSFDMTKSITKMDLIKMLVEAKGYRPYMLTKAEALKTSGIDKSDVNYKYLQMAVYYGIIQNTSEDLNVSGNVTREEMAKALVKALGYDNLANASDIFTLPVSDSTDVTKTNIGYIAIAKGLGILETEDSKLRPKDKATSLELAIGIYKVLGNLRTNEY